MKNKSLLIRGFLLVVVFCFCWFSFSSASVTLKLNIESVHTLTDSILKRSIMPIHFADNWNDFWWFMYFSNWVFDEEDEEDLLSQEIFKVELKKSWSSKEIKECKRQMKWFYYNAERGERLWPLDSETWSAINTITWYVTTEGWIYTLCRSEWYAAALSGCASNPSELQADCVAKVDQQYAQDNAYYGMVKHTLTGSLWWETFYLLAGVDYKTNSSPWITVKVNTESKFAPNFIRYQNKIPVWLVYDKNGGVWFVGCRITEMSSASNILKKIINVVNWSWVESLFVPDFDVDGNENGIRYTGSVNNIPVDCSDIGTAENSLVKLVIEGLVWMNRESDLWVIGNQTNAKMQYFSSSDINNATLLNYAKQRSEILCRGKWNIGTDEDIVCKKGSSGDEVNADDYKGKTLVVKNMDVKVTPFNDPNATWHYDIFINGWSLIINESETDEKFVFDKNWFIMTGETFSGFNSIISWSYVGGWSYTWDLVAVGSFIRGNFVVNWKVKAAAGNTLANKYFIYGKFMTKDSLNELEDKFTWRCNNWYTTDWSYCPPSVKWWTNPYENAFLVVIDQNYDSLLFWQ